MPFQKGNKLGLGRSLSAASRKKISEKLKGHPVPEQQRARQSATRIGKYSGENAGHWLGDKVGYKGIHIWIWKNRPKPETCEECNEKRKLTAACINRVYTRNIDNFRWLCWKCHNRHDGASERCMNAGLKTRFKKGNIPWNKGKKGVQVPWNKGISMGSSHHSGPQDNHCK